MLLLLLLPLDWNIGGSILKLTHIHTNTHSATKQRRIVNIHVHGLGHKEIRDFEFSICVSDIFSKLNKRILDVVESRYILNNSQAAGNKLC